MTDHTADQNRQLLTTLADLGIATHRHDQIRDAARLHRQQLIGTSELYAVIEAAAPAVSAGVAPATAAPAVWIDGHPQLEAIAAAVWEHCGRSDSGMCVEDDPRNIAVAALAAVLPTTTDQTAEIERLREELDTAKRHLEARRIELLRVNEQHRMDHEEAPADRAAVLREAADIAEGLRQFEPAYGARKSAQVSENVGILRVAAELRRVAAEAGPADTGQDGDFTESVIYEVVGDWGVDSADSAEGARAAVAKWLRAYPKCGAYAQQRVVREWPDGSEFYGPWTDLPEQPAAAQPPPKEA